MKMFKIAALSLAAGVAALGATSFAVAQEGGPTLTLDQVLQQVRRARAESSEENRAREARFVQDRNNQQAELARVRSQVNAAEARSTSLETTMAANQAEIDRLDAELADKQGEFQELFGAARSAAADLKNQLEGSIISAEYPGRAEQLREVAETETLPSEVQLRFLWETMVQQIAEQSKVSKFSADVAQADGTASNRTITRIGPFVAFSDGKYLVYDRGQQQLEFLARQPASAVTDAARRVENFSGSGYTKGVVDPSLGQLLGLIVETPTFMERVDQGGTVGYITLGLAGLAFLLGVYKWVTLTMTAGAVNAQVRRQKASKANPLGRVMLAYEGLENKDTETVALKLDDAILREIPKLESGLNLVKVIAAVAPLLGLLGTVVGMIVTFQAITLFGTGDPQIMASGISQALVTTVIGLVSAIPLLLLHAFGSGALKRIAQVLEEQAAGIIAEHAENRR